MTRKRSFFVLAYKDSAGFFLAAGQQRYISCNHQNEGVFYVNTVGEEVPLPQTTVPPLSGNPTTDYNSATAGVPQGNVYANSHVFGDSNYKRTYRIKDLETLVTTYVDTASYDTNVISCNLVPYPIGCAIVTNLSAGTPAATTATITWTANPAGTGYEWINNTSSTAPTGDGAFTEASSQAITGLTAATTYHFWIRTICGPGSLGVSAWTSLTYTTHA